MINKTIIQFGLSRTGSTLIYRILKEIFLEVKKCHLPEVQKHLGTSTKIVATIRDPIDAFISHVRVSHYPDSYPSIIPSAVYANYMNQRLHDHKKFNKILGKNKDQILLLKYEDFYNNIDLAITKIAEFCDIIIDKPTRVNIQEACSLDSAIEIQSSMSSFNEYDESTFIHGRHIASPEPGAPKLFLAEKDLNFLTRLFKEEIERWEKI